MKKKIVIIFGILLFILTFFSIKSNAATINTKKVNIYAINERQQQKYNLTIPSNYPQSYTLKVSGNKGTPIYKVEGAESEDAITVSEKGVIAPKPHRVNYVGIGTFTDYEYGKFNVSVTVDNQKFNVEVNLINYPTKYAENIMDKYISNNIKSSMTQMEKLNKICEFVASYDYSASGSSYTSMILGDGGDCWASSDTILYMCEKVGITAYLRYGVNDYGAGNGHRNVTAIIDEKVYVVEAGYDEKAPRYYSIYEEEGGFFFKTKSDGTLKLVQYDGKNTNVVVPSTYNGKKVTEIANNAFYYGNAYSGIKITNVTLPNTITTIGESAFYGCKNLKQVNIPNSVNNIEGAMFTKCEDVKININANHPYYTISDGIIYNKNKTKVIECLPTKKGQVTLPSTVTTIGVGAFAESNISNVILGNKVTTIEKNAFYCSGIEGITIPKSVTSIGEQAFYNSNVRSIIIEEGCKATIENYAIWYCSYLDVIEIPSTVTNIKEDAMYKYVNMYVRGKSGSTAQKYANSKNIKFVEKSGNAISKQMIKKSQNEYVYNGTSQRPKLTVYYGSKLLKEGTDYTCTYPSDTTNAGEKEITIKGKGTYTGTQKLTYEIKRAKYEINFKCDNVTYGQKPNPVATNLPKGVEVTFMYKKSEDAYVASSGRPTEVGTHWVYASAYDKSGNYYFTSKTISFKILPATNKLGDINKDGKVNAKDARLALLYYIGKEKLTAEQIKIGDVNKDGKVNAKDARQILLYYIGKITKF